MENLAKTGSRPGTLRFPWPLFLLWAAPALGADAGPFLKRGHALYFKGEGTKALEAYQAAARANPKGLEAWLNGAAVLEELGRQKEAVRWYGKAAALQQADESVFNALAWAEFRAGENASAGRHFKEALARDGEHPEALLGLARVEMRLGRAAEAMALLEKASAAAPRNTLLLYFKGKAAGLLGDRAGEMKALRQAVSADSLFTEAREDLGLAQARVRNLPEAYKQFSKALDADPGNRRFANQLGRLKAAVAAVTRPGGAAAASSPPVPPSTLGEGLPASVRVCVGANMQGKPVARKTAAWSVNTPFWLVESPGGRKLARGEADQAWTARWSARKKGAVIEYREAGGKLRLASARPVFIRPDSDSRGVISVSFTDCADGAECLSKPERRLRGELELSLYAPRKGLNLVNRLNAEDYTHGVLSMEMPIGSPVEALKAQATLARSHALYIKAMTRRHAKERCDVCDTQHCQVYGGIAAETARSLEILKATRGCVVTYRGKPAHVIYSANCGGRTQGGSDVTGWGGLPYWLGVSERLGDAPGGQEGEDRPASPWELRQWLTGTPAVFCRPSTYVHAASFRWSRVLSRRDLEEKFNRTRRIGRLLSLRPGRRAPSGHLNSCRVVGTRGSFVINNETSLRSLLGIGSLRSTLFVIETEYNAKLVPETYVIRGGGWGHGVGMCQSGAMGRAEAGQAFTEIIKAYFKGTSVDCP